MNRLAELFRQYRIPYGNELAMQDAVEKILTIAGIPFHREFRLGKDRVDFFADGIAIECKVDGGPSSVASQLLRYAQFDSVTGVILITSRRTHRFNTSTLLNKPFSVVWVAAQI